MTFWRSVIFYDRAKVAVWVAARNAAGVALALTAGFLSGHAAGGVIAALGALNVAYSDSPSPYLQRGRRMLSTCFFGALAVLVGGIVGREHAGIIPISAFAAFLAGMCVALGPAAADLGNICLATLIVFAAQGVPANEAAASGLAAFGGGLVQIALSLALWPVHRYQPEQHVLAALFDALAQAASREANSLESPPASAESTAAQQALASLAGNHAIEAERYLALASQAERIRLSLVALARVAVRLEREGSADLVIVDRARHAAAEVLSQIGAELQPGSRGMAAGTALAAMRTAEGELRDATEPLAREARWQIDALAGQLRGASQLAFDATPSGLAQFEARESGRERRLRLGGAAAALRANFSFRSVAFRHAVRLAICVGIGEALAYATGSRRGYWIPMTVGIILRPEFTNTFSRGILRLGGTLAGLVLATGIVHFFRPGPAAQVALISLFEFAMRAYGPANYGIFVTAITALVVFLIAVTGTDPGPAMMARGWNTLAGGAIALLAYAAWPTWERKVAPEMIAEMLDRYRDYFGAVRDAYLDPGANFDAQLDRTRLAARLARSNFEALLARLPHEPGLSERSLTKLHRLLADSQRFIHAAMALESGLARSAPVPARDATRTLMNDIDQTLYYLAAQLRRASQRREDLPDLRADHSALVREGDPSVDRYLLVNTETDRMVNSLNTLAEEVFDYRG
jgi:uncharacterized membrane protein YccC